MLILSLLISFSVHAQVDVQKTNYLLSNILPNDYKVEIVEENKLSDRYKFVPRQMSSATLSQARNGTLLTDNAEDLDESKIIVQSWDDGQGFELYTAQKNQQDWSFHRYTDGKNSSKNLTLCETDKKSEGFLDFKTPIFCVFASERLCKKPHSEWPAESKLSKENFSSFFGDGLDGGFRDYIKFSDGQNSALRDRMSNSYSISNFKTNNRIEEAYKMDNGFEGDAVRAAVVTQVKSLCAKAWPNHNDGAQYAPTRGQKRGAPSGDKSVPAVQ